MSNGTLAEKIKEAEETNINSVSRLIANNPIAISKYIPTWKNTTLLLEEIQSRSASLTVSSTPNVIPGNGSRNSTSAGLPENFTEVHF